MIYDVFYANWHRILMGRDTDFAVTPVTTKPKCILTDHSII